MNYYQSDPLAQTRNLSRQIYGDRKVYTVHPRESVNGEIRHIDDEPLDITNLGFDLFAARLNRA